jgi:hypothetical protein
VAVFKGWKWLLLILRQVISGSSLPMTPVRRPFVGRPPGISFLRPNRCAKWLTVSQPQFVTMRA